MDDRADARLAECPDDDACELVRIEVDFTIPVLMTQDQQRRMLDLLDELVSSPWNQLAEGVHWVSGYGSKPRWSKVDAVFLGKPVAPDAPESGEPDFDDDVFHVASSARGFVSDRERERVMCERAAGRAPSIPLDELEQLAREVFGEKFERFEHRTRVRASEVITLYADGRSLEFSNGSRRDPDAVRKHVREILQNALVLRAREVSRATGVDDASS